MTRSLVSAPDSGTSWSLISKRPPYTGNNRSNLELGAVAAAVTLAGAARRVLVSAPAGSVAPTVGLGAEVAALFAPFELTEVTAMAFVSAPSVVTTKVLDWCTTCPKINTARRSRASPALRLSGSIGGSRAGSLRLVAVAGCGGRIAAQINNSAAANPLACAAMQ